MEELEDKLNKGKGRKILKLGLVGTAIAAGALALYASYTALQNSERKLEAALEAHVRYLNSSIHFEDRHYTKEDSLVTLTEEGKPVTDKIGQYLKLQETTEKETQELLKFAEENAEIIKKSRVFSDLIGAIKSGYEKSKQAEKELPGFLEYLDKNWKQFYEKVVNEEFEQGGAITRKDNCYEIVFKEDPVDRLIRSYISEIVEGNFSHENELMEFVKKHARVRFHDNPEMKDKLMKTVEDNVGALKEAYKKNDKDIPEDIELRCGEALCIVRDLARLSYSITAPKELLNPDSGFIFAWHTHPTVDSVEENHGPSQPDKNSYGPNIVFASYQDRLEVHSIILGKSKLLRTYKAK